MKTNNKNISIVVGIILISTALIVGYKLGYELGYNKEFYQTHDIECTYGNNLKVKSTIYNREWSDGTSKITTCSKEDENKVLKRLKKEGKLIIKYSKIRKKLIKESKVNATKRKSNPLLTVK